MKLSLHFASDLPKIFSSLADWRSAARSAGIARGMIAFGSPGQISPAGSTATGSFGDGPFGSGNVNPRGPIVDIPSAAPFPSMTSKPIAPAGPSAVPNTAIPLGSVGDVCTTIFCSSHTTWGNNDDQQTLIVGLGNHPDIPDNRDLQVGTKKADRVIDRIFRDVRDSDTVVVKKNLLSGTTFETKPFECLVKPEIEKVWPVEDQGQVNSCSAHAVIGLVEFLLMEYARRPVDLSRLFLYGMTRRLLGWHGDPGASIRATIKALKTFGVPPEGFWPYDANHFDANPDAFLFAYAADFKPMTYLRLDGYGPESILDSKTPGQTTLERLKRVLSAQLPVTLGFPVYSCIRDDSEDIPNPNFRDKLIGAHAVLAVGYRETKPAPKPEAGGKSTKRNANEPSLKPAESEEEAWRRRFPKGAIRIRNSWGPKWGKNGYGWLPYEYIENNMASDFWTVLSPDWLGSKDDQRDGLL